MSWQFAHGHFNLCQHSIKTSVHTDGKMHQQAAPELTALQQEPPWTASDLQVSGGQSVAVQHVRGPSWFAEFTLRPGDASASGLLLRSWLYSGPEVSQACAAALLIDWNKSQLQVCFAMPLHASPCLHKRNALCQLAGCYVDLTPAPHLQLTALTSQLTALSITR